MTFTHLKPRTQAFVISRAMRRAGALRVPLADDPTQTRVTTWPEARLWAQAHPELLDFSGIEELEAK